MEDTPRTSGTGRRKFIAGAGAAAAAATAGMLATSSPAGASAITESEDISDALKWLDFSSGDFGGSVTLGTDGYANATFSPFGDMVALMVQIYLGSGSDPGDGPWCLDPTDPSFDTFVPVGVTNFDSPAVTPWWLGSGSILDLAASGSFNQCDLGCVWQNFSDLMPSIGTVLVWGIGGPVLNSGNGDVMLNYGGDGPFGGVLNDGTMLTTTTIYQVA